MCEISGLYDDRASSADVLFTDGRFPSVWSGYAHDSSSNTRLTSATLNGRDLSTRPTDREAQEEPLKPTWIGGGSVFAVSTQNFADLSCQSNGAKALSFYARPFSDKIAAINVGMACARKQNGPAFRTATIASGDWRNYRLSLSGSADAGIDMTSFLSGFLARSTGPTSIRPFRYCHRTRS
ncbi:MAG: putative glycoside hydrolase [Pseudomonadota bacterium]